MEPDFAVESSPAVQTNTNITSIDQIQPVVPDQAALAGVDQISPQSTMSNMTVTYGNVNEVPSVAQPSTLSVTRFPENIGTPTPGVVTSAYATSGTGHYMMFFINTQKKTQYPQPLDPANVPQRVANANRFAGREDATSDIMYEFSNINNTNRTTEAIVLQIPDTLAFSNHQSYDEFSVGGTFGSVAMTGLQSVEDYMKSRKSAGEASSQAGKNAATGVAAIMSKYIPGIGGQGQAIFQNLIGLAINPMMEVIYSKPNFRQFRFDFLLYPRSKSEARSLQNLIRRFRYHHSPEIYKESHGFFLVPPSTFDIKFYYNGTENENLDPISTCVLETIDVDYAPQGWSAYEELNKQTPELGGTGMPVGIRLSLQFRETEYMTKDHYRGTGLTAADDLANGIRPI